MEFDVITQALERSNQSSGPAPPPYGGGLCCQVTEAGAAISDVDVPVYKTAEAGRPKRKNRTLAQAVQAGMVTVMPCHMALTTLAPYQNALTTNKNPTAYIQPLIDHILEHLTYRNGVPYFNGLDMTKADLEHYCDDTPKAVSSIDLILLRTVYSIILDQLEKETEGMTAEDLLAKVSDAKFDMYSVKIYMPKFLAMMGYGANINERNIKTVVDRLNSYNRAMGRMMRQRGQTNFPIMLSGGYDPDDNSMVLTSPYINKLITTLFRASIQTGKGDKPKTKRDGRPFTLPSNSYLVKSSIAKERNKRAVEIVCVVVILIEQAGDNIPHIKAQTIIDRVPDLKYALEAATITAEKNRLLRRAFTKAWELLQTQTELKKVYKNIHFPDQIPTSTKLGTMTFEFPHDGKN